MAIGKRLRFEILKRDGFRCRYCGKVADASALHVDHVRPVSKGGKDIAENLVAACIDCNAGKSGVPLTVIKAARTPADVAIDSALGWARHCAQSDADAMIGKDDPAPENGWLEDGFGGDLPEGYM